MSAKPKRLSERGLLLSHRIYLVFNLIFGAISFALGVNFLNATPAFNPYELSLDLIGAVFLALGIAKLATTIRWPKVLPYVLATDIAFMLFWALGSFISWRQGLTSWQLGAWIIGVCAIEFVVMIASPVRLVTENPE